MMADEEEKRPLVTKQDLKDFAITAVITGGLEALLTPEGSPLGVGELAFSGLLWGVGMGYFRSKRLGSYEGVRAGLASSAGAVGGKICGYILNNYETILMPFM